MESGLTGGSNPLLPAATVRIYEIYDSIQGESTLAGTPCTIVRLAGCPLRCSYCDTPQALSAQSGKERRIRDIVRQVEASQRPLCLVTGGEPLAQKSCRALLQDMADVCPTVQLETSGAFDISGIDPRIHRILDIKTPGSGEVSRNRWGNLRHLHEGDEIKFVLTGISDYQWAMEIIAGHKLARLHVPVLFSPVWGLVQPADLAAWILRDHAPGRLHPQYHKHIWGSGAEHV